MNGISRQPALLRSPDQTEDELNTWGDIARGVGRRPPTQTIRKLDGLALGDATVHHINRDINERYTVIIDNGAIQVFDETTGDAKVVNAPLGWGYLDAAGPNYRAVTVADYTFIVNTQKVVAMKSAGSDQTAPDASLRFPGGTNPRDVNSVMSRVFAGDTVQYNANPTYSGGLTGTVPDMTKLPDPPCSGCVYKVLGQNETSFVSYYVMGDGTVWNETVEPGLENSLDEITMPHALIREADGTFSFAPFSWQPRRVGDRDTNPVPPFIGRTIRDVFFFQNRLAFLADESVIFSGAGDYGDFWRRTVLDYIDSDALAASAATTDVALLDYAVPFADGVMLFSKQRQLSLTNGDSGLSAHSLAISPVTSYIMSSAVHPTPMGSQVHFVTDSSGQTAVQEYTRLAGADPTEAADITAHVPGLLPQGATQLIPAHDLNALFVLTRDASADKLSKLYAYQFFWDGDKKIQSAWRVWDLGDGQPVSGSYESGALHLLVERPDGFFLEKIDLSPQAVSTNQDHILYLDRQQALTGVYNAGTNTTTFTAAFAIDPAKVQLVRGKGSSAPEGVISPSAYTVSGATLTVPGDESGAQATLGHLYTTKLVLSEQFPQDWQGHLLTTGRLVLHTFTVNLANTAYTRADVYPYGLDAFALDSGLLHSTVFTGQHVGWNDAVLGKRGYHTGPFEFSVAGASNQARVELVNDSAFASTWTSAEWEGLFFSRAL
jgi:hypothetical protein